MASATTPRIVIIGGVAGGAGAAAAARRANERAKIDIYESGDHISFANCGLPYRISGEIESTEKLLIMSAAKMKERFNVDVHLRHEVISIARAERTIRVRNLNSNAVFDCQYDRLIIATGARPIRPVVEGMQHRRILECRTIADVKALLAALDAHPLGRALVIGSGFIGVEVAEALQKRKFSVTMIDLANQILPPWDIEFAGAAQEEMSRHGVHFKLNAKVDNFVHHENESVARLSTGESVSFDVAILAIGVTPDTALAKTAGLRIGSVNGIQVDEFQRTSDENIFAAGDCTELVYWPTGLPLKLALAGPANKEARVAGANAATLSGPPYSYSFTGAAGTSIVRVFDLTVAMTGLSEKACIAKSTPYEVVYTQNGHHASYFPDAQPVFIKLVFSPADGCLLGGQIFGKQGVDKRIDVLAVALQAHFTVDQMTNLDLAYSPPFGAAKDPLVIAAEAASNVFHHRVQVVTPASLSREVATSAAPPLLLDVRTPEEIASQGSITGRSSDFHDRHDFLAIPIDSLRANLHRISKGRPIVSFCFVGYRGYLASCILQQEGYQVRNLTGGFRAWRVYHTAVNSS